jgi:hypothetical protein
MSDWPVVWLIFTTYKRTNIALQSIESLKRHLIYPNLHWHVCDDGSGKTDDGTNRQHVSVLTEAIGGDVTYHEMPREHPYDFDVGGNVNRGMFKAKENGCEIILMNFDDFALTADLDLCPMVDLLDSHPCSGLIRLSYWVHGYAGMCVERHLPHLNQTYLWMRLIREWSTDAYLFSMQPHIAHLRFFDTYGWYVEHSHPGITETEMCRQFNNGRKDGPQIYFPLGRRFVHVPYRHIAPRQQDYADAVGIYEYEDLNAR